MAKFHTLRIADVRKETTDCVSVAFDVPAALKAEFSYIQGQYLTLKLKVKGEELRRSYSLCSSPIADTEYRIAVKKVKDGKGSVHINDSLRAGDTIEVMTPMGNFYTPVSASNKKKYILFAGGSGITPMLSILKTILKAEPNSSLHLFYGNRDESSCIFKKTLDDLAAAHPNAFSLHHIFENPSVSVDSLYTGQLNKEKVRALIQKHIPLVAENEYFVCGPGPMMENVKAVLSDLRVNEKQIHIEYFTAVLEAVKKAEAESASGASDMCRVTVIMDGKETAFDLATNGQVILDQALDAGVDVPYACKGAVCCTCRAKIKEGKVKMDNNYALTDNEVKDGYILTCQSHPLTGKVVIDYDV
jgi:ring-1,2-phenylacetyl-CoA epoxidase subunit PaaE